MTASWRRADAADARLLTDLERDANLVALAHVFPAAEHPFPYDGVLGRWVEVLADAGVTVDVVDGPGRLDAVTAYDAVRLRHVAVHPDAWRRGLGGEAVARAVAGGAHRLWCLEANDRARRLYGRLGWEPSGRTQQAEWPPYPTEMEYVRPGAVG